jgi:hypothetical protein
MYSGPLAGPGPVHLASPFLRADHNWRDPVGQAKSSVTPGPDDRGLQEADLVSRDPQSPDFLRPADKSPLATQAAGVEDPALPRYAGALPPRGEAAWDWDKVLAPPADKP